MRLYYYIYFCQKSPPHTHRPFSHPSNYDLLFIQYWVIISRLCRIFQIFLQTVLSNSTWWILRWPKDRWDIKTLLKTPGTTKVLLCETLVIPPLLSYWGSSISFKLLFQIPSSPQFFSPREHHRFLSPPITCFKSQTSTYQFGSGICTIPSFGIATPHELVLITFL